MSEHRAEGILREYRKDFKLGWGSMGKWSDENIQNHDMPEWCLLPYVAWGDLASITTKTYRPTDISLSDMLRDREMFTALGLWRLSKGVYHISQELITELMRTQLNDTMPSNVIMRLPEWCIYVELQGVLSSKVFDIISGAWVYLSYESSLKKTRLWITLDCGSSGPGYRQGLSVMPCSYVLSESSISDVIASSVLEQIEVRKSIDKKYNTDSSDMEQLSDDEQVEMFHGIVKILLYICSSEPDIEDRQEPDARPSLARPKLVGKRDMFVAADRVRVWNVGDKVGEQIRKAREEPSDRAHTRRHLRRAHWHGYWTGSRGSDDRQFTYKWLSPMVVGVT